MPARNSDSGERPETPAFLERLRTDDHSADRLLRRLSAMIDCGADIDDIVALVNHIRVTGDPEQIRSLEKFLLERFTSYQRGRRELEAALGEMRTKVEQFMSPPYFPARFLGTVTTPGGEYARVSLDGSSRLVEFEDKARESAIQPGDEVYLCQERNLLIARAPRSGKECGETAEVVRLTEDGRLVINDRDTEVVVSIGNTLDTENLTAGDLVLWDRNARIALDHLQSANRQLDYEDISSFSKEKLGGLDQIRDGAMARFVYSITNPELAGKYQVLGDSGRRLLLHGPPGTGKTSLMRAIASEIAKASDHACRVVAISGAELYSPYVGETERNIRRCFERLREYDGPGLAFFDEIDTIGRARGHSSGFHDDRFLGTLLAELEGIHRNDIAVVAATNRADALDPALRGRFGLELEISRPKKPAARQIFSIYISDDLPYRPNSSEAPKTRRDIIECALTLLFEPNADNRIASLQFRDGKRRVVVAGELMSGRLIEQICNAARSSAFERECRGGEAGLTVEDMHTAAADAIERLRSTLTPKNARNYLPDLPQDVDVVSVETLRSAVNTAHYRM